MPSRLPSPARSHAHTAAARLLDWYDRHARALPWRVGPADRRAGIRPDPYHVWLSEVMLQQTQVATVGEYYRRFLARWPTVADLAAAPADEVLKAWAGLGYYSRARNLKKCAEAVALAHGGRFPQTAAGLRQLPGIGDYTAAAVAAIAFDEAVAVIDGNVERVVARLNAIDTPPARARLAIRAGATAMLPPARFGDFAQALMDLGATVCTPRRPSCRQCPLNAECAARAGGTPEAYPVRQERDARPLRRGAAFVAIDAGGAVLLRRRPTHGLLGGMAAVPTSDWTARADGATGIEAAPFAAPWLPAGGVRHVFTHFALELEVWRARLDRRPAAEGWWSAPDALAGEALPSVMRKVIEAAIPGATKRATPA
ncbi:MAG: A/G-specific adenine glycosylase [Alphaproteobacteria bacterium]|nr:MAG: A/G-specific adenine glycosylase [Alphaproteobacteria bacterium]